MLCLYFVLIEVCMHVDVMAEVIIVKIRILMAVCHRLCVGITFTHYSAYIETKHQKILSLFFRFYRLINNESS